MLLCQVKLTSFLKVIFIVTELSKKVITFGCRLNNLESELINQQLKQYLIDKDVFIFNTCAVTSEA